MSSEKWPRDSSPLEKDALNLSLVVLSYEYEL